MTSVVTPLEFQKDGLWVNVSAQLDLMDAQSNIKESKVFNARYRPSLDGTFKENVEDELFKKMKKFIDLDTEKETEQKKPRFIGLKSNLEGRLNA
ncbi:MAG: hypothetical protein ACE5EH_12960 [Gammaproteobacteria bacterium]